MMCAVCQWGEIDQMFQFCCIISHFLSQCGLCLFFTLYIVQIFPCQIYVHCIHSKFFNPSLFMSLSVCCLSLPLSLCPFFFSLNLFLVLSIYLSLSFSILSSLSLRLYPSLSTPPSLPLLLSHPFLPNPSFLSLSPSFLSLPLSLPLCPFLLPLYLFLYPILSVRMRYYSLTP